MPFGGRDKDSGDAGCGEKGNFIVRRAKGKEAALLNME